MDTPHAGRFPVHRHSTMEFLFYSILFLLFRRPITFESPFGIPSTLSSFSGSQKIYARSAVISREWLLHDYSTDSREVEYFRVSIWTEKMKWNVDTRWFSSERKIGMFIDFSFREIRRGFEITRMNHPRGIVADSDIWTFENNVLFFSSVGVVRDVEDSGENRRKLVTNLILWSRQDEG